MVELARCVVLQVGPARAHPQRVALEHDVLARNALGVELDQAAERQRMGAVQPEVGEALCSRPLVEVVGQGLLPGHVFAPDDGIADEQRVVMVGGQSGEALEEPVIVAQVVRDPIIGLEREPLAAVPQRGGEREEQHREQPEAEPLPAGQADAVGQRDRASTASDRSTPLRSCSSIVHSPPATIRTGNR